MSTVLLTADGSHTLYVPEIDESYHSTNGAMQESMHIFINAALRQHPQPHLSVFEVGFGTGLNAYLTLLEAEKTGCSISYTAIEKFPVAMDVAASLNYEQQVLRYNYQEGNGIFKQLHNAAWNVRTTVTPHFALQKIQADLLTFQMGENVFDIIYFDAFSPAKQPEMWSETIFNRIFASCKPNAILTTYCAKGAVRRALQQAGFQVERLQGPAGKREILRAVKPATN